MVLKYIYYYICSYEMMAVIVVISHMEEAVAVRFHLELPIYKF